MIKRLRLIIGLIFLMQPLLGETISQNFIFDFNGVLMGTNTFASLKGIGLNNVIQCMIHLQKSPFLINTHIKSKFFEILTLVADSHSFDPNQSQPAFDEHGTPIPYLMRAWLDGTMTTSSIKRYSLEAIEQHPEWFEHKTEKQVICNLIKTIFTPEKFIKTRKIYNNCISFIKACKKRGHKVFALSNWDKESFALLQNKFPQVFDLFDGIVISGETNSLKPSPEIYSTLLSRYTLEPSLCWFIDDQQENVTAALTLGINGIMCHQKKLSKKPDFHRVAQTIKNTVMLQRHDALFEKTMEQPIPL